MLVMLSNNGGGERQSGSGWKRKGGASERASERDIWHLAEMEREGLFVCFIASS